MPPNFLSQPHIARLPDILAELANGTLAIPRFQRPMVWSEQQGIHLLESVRDGLPMGAILVWRSQRKLSVFPSVVGVAVAARPDFPVYSYLIDGHQRLGVLFSALYSHSEDESEEIEEGDLLTDEQQGEPRPPPWTGNRVWYDLEQEEFVVGGPAKEGFLPLTLLADGKGFRAFVRALPDSLADRAESLLDAFTVYAVPVCSFATDDLSVVTRTFQRINSNATPMTRFEIVFALCWTENFNLAEAFDEVLTLTLPKDFSNHESLLDLCGLILDFASDTPYYILGEELARQPDTVEELASRIRFLNQSLRDDGLGDLSILESLGLLSHIFYWMIAASTPDVRKSVDLRRHAFRNQSPFSGALARSILSAPVKLRQYLSHTEIVNTLTEYTKTIANAFAGFWAGSHSPIRYLGWGQICGAANMNRPLLISSEVSEAEEAFISHHLSIKEPFLHSNLTRKTATQKLEVQQLLAQILIILSKLSPEVLHAWYFEADAQQALQDGDITKALELREAAILRTVEAWFATPITPPPLPDPKPDE